MRPGQSASSTVTINLCNLLPKASTKLATLLNQWASPVVSFIFLRSYFRTLLYSSANLSTSLVIIRHAKKQLTLGKRVCWERINPSGQDVSLKHFGVSGTAQDSKDLLAMLQTLTSDVEIGHCSYYLRPGFRFWLAAPSQPHFCRLVT